MKDFHVGGSHLTLTVSSASDNHPAMIWELDATDSKLTGVQKQGDRSTPLTGVRAPESSARRQAMDKNPSRSSMGRISMAGSRLATWRIAIGW